MASMAPHEVGPVAQEMTLKRMGGQSFDASRRPQRRRVLPADAQDY